MLNVANLRRLLKSEDLLKWNLNKWKMAYCNGHHHHQHHLIRSSSQAKILTMDSLNPHIIRMDEPLIVSSVHTRAIELQGQLLQQGVNKNFKEIIFANTDDLQSIGQQPLTFLRQVVSLISYPALMQSSDFPEDAKERAIRVLRGCYGNSVGSYTDGMGIEFIRNNVARYIEKRDNGIPSDVEDIFLSTGSSDAIESILTLLTTGRNSPSQAGVMVPVPSDSIYSSLITRLNSYVIPYHLDEESNWQMNINDLEKALNAVRVNHCSPRALIIVNPGSQTGHVMTRENVESVIRFAYKENLFVLADETHQQSVFASDVEFHSFKKVLKEMGKPYEDMELASFMSASKGYTSEGGLRAGYCEAINLDPQIKLQLLKLFKTCPPVPGQAALDVVVNPPLPNDPSYVQYQKETRDVLIEAKSKARMVSQVLHATENVSCVEPKAGIFVFGKISLPRDVIKHAEKKGIHPDEMYCRQLLEETGVCLMPGSELGQKEGTHHFRMTLVPSSGQMKQILEKFKEFHFKFISK